MKGFGGDVISIAAVLTVLLAFVAAFPREAIGFSAAAEVPRTSAPSVSIVFLDSDSAVRAMRSARMLSKREGGTAGADLLSAELPGTDVSPMMPVESRSRAKAPAVVESRIPSFLPSRRAAAPVRIRGEKGGDTLPFPRSELLKLN